MEPGLQHPQRPCEMTFETKKYLVMGPQFTLPFNKAGYIRAVSITTVMVSQGQHFAKAYPSVQQHPSMENIYGQASTTASGDVCILHFLDKNKRPESAAR